MKLPPNIAGALQKGRGRSLVLTEGLKGWTAVLDCEEEDEHYAGAEHDTPEWAILALDDMLARNWKGNRAIPAK